MSLFHKRHKDETLKVAVPVSGTILDITDVPDPVFAGQHMGPGFAVDPTSGEFTSPIDGEVTLVAPTLHAVGLKAGNGAEILVHIGIDTAELKGDGFTVHVHEGDTVSVGDPLLTVDRSGTEMVVNARGIGFGRHRGEIVDGTLGIHLQPEEWVAFALHFINHQWDGKGVSRTVTMTQAISEVFTELEELWQVKIDRSSMTASRFVTHLRYLFARAADNKQLSHIDLDIMGLMSDRYPAATSAALTVAERISTAVGGELTKAEINYIALHTSRLYGEVMGVED